jgi:hypothetical protein
MLRGIATSRPHPAALSEAELLKHCQIGKGRSSGPGGQHRNKVETLVIITHAPTQISAKAGERRSAGENRRVAIFRLRLALALKARADVQSGDGRSQLWRARCTSEGRIVCSPEHRDYPALLAEALDMISACNLELQKVALRLACSPSQLIKLVKDHPPALELLNQARQEAGMGVLR